MFVYLTLLIPIAITLGFYFWKKHEFVWWEFFIPVLITLGIIVLTKFIFDTSSVTFKESWGSTVVEVYESEPWNEWINQTCSCCCDDEGNNCSTYDCSYQDNHGPRWYAETNIGENIRISESTYDKTLKSWGGEKVKTRTRRNHSARSRARYSNKSKFKNTKVGKVSYIWKTTWDNKDNTRVPYTSKHKYENRVKASDLTVFNISVVKNKDVDTLGLIKYPDKMSGIYVPTIIGDSTISYDIQTKFRRLNGKFGPTNQIRLWILVYRDAPSITSTYQENYWVKGNKNELVVTMSLDTQNNVQWTNSFSWALSDGLTAEAKAKLIEIGKMDDAGWNLYYIWMNENLHRFDRRYFAEFSYIKLKPSKASIITIIILAILSSVGLNIAVTTNEIRENRQPF